MTDSSISNNVYTFLIFLVLSLTVQRYDNPPKQLLHKFRGILPNSENRTFFPCYSLKPLGIGFIGNASWLLPAKVGGRA